MNVQVAASRTLEFLAGEFRSSETEHMPQPEKSDYGNTLEHAVWMLEGISDGYIQYEKAHRWLGWAQCLVVVLTSDAGVGIRLEHMKCINKDS